MYCDNCGCEMTDGMEKCPVCGKEFPKIAQPDEAGGQLGVDLNKMNGQPGAAPDKMNGQPGAVPSMMNGQPGAVPSMMNGQPQGINMPPNGDDILIKKKGEKKKMSRGAKAALITIPIVIVLAVGVLAFIFVPKFRQYNEAADKLAAGDVEAAVDMYKDLGDFKDSSELASGGAYYSYAEGLEKDGRTLEAAEYYKKAAGYGYKDSEDKANRSYYNSGIDSMNAASYDAAIEAFTNAGNYSDAADKVIECKYKKAETLVSSEEYDKAIEILTQLDGYGDSAALLGQCYYNKAENLFSQKSYDDAYDMYIKSEYNDYKDKANECIYQKASGLYDSKDYKKALDCYNKIDADYRDCTAEKDKCYIALASEAYDSKEYKQAVDYYECVVKEDVAKKITKAKIAFIKANKSLSNETTMLYLGQLRYSGNKSAKKLYAELVDWEITSYVNNSQDDYDTQKNTIKGDGEIYVHTSFANSSEDSSMKIEGYVQYADGNKSDTVTFSDNVVDGWSTWVKINGADAPKGVTYLYLKNSSTGNIIEVYPFTIE